MSMSSYVINGTNNWNEKSAFIDRDGDFVIEHDEQSVIVDIEQAKQLIEILNSFVKGAAK